MFEISGTEKCKRIFLSTLPKKGNSPQKRKLLACSTLIFRNWGVTFLVSVVLWNILLACTPFGNFKICKWKGEEFIYSTFLSTVLSSTLYLWSCWLLMFCKHFYAFYEWIFVYSLPRDCWYNNIFILFMQYYTFLSITFLSFHNFSRRDCLKKKSEKQISHCLK